MPPDAPLDESVHVLDVAPRRSRRWPAVAGVAALLAAGASGVWIVLTDPFAAAEVARAPAPRPGNLLGDGWSFETTESTSPSQAWTVPDDAPAGFAFGARGAVSGQQGAAAVTSEAGWSRLVSAVAFRLEPGRAVAIAAESDSDGAQLLLRFEADRLASLDLTVASGAGALAGVVVPPPGYTHVRAGLGAVGEAALDDVELTFVPPPADAPAPLPAGLFTLHPLPQGALLQRGDEPVLHLVGLAVREADGRLLPPAAAAFPGSGELALSDGRRIAATLALASEGGRVVLTASHGEPPEGAGVQLLARLLGSLAAAPVGVGGAGGFAAFTDDFRVERSRALVLGRTQDRVVVGGDELVIAGAWQGDGGVALTLAPAEGRAGLGALTIQTSFQAERVEAAQLRDRAADSEARGRLGEALALLDRVVGDYPYDEDVLADASARRARLLGAMQVRLDAIDRDLEDALFLASARRCREVLAESLAAAEAFAGSEAEARFREQADTVASRAAELLAEDRDRRVRRLTAIRDSFAEAGGFDLVVDEIERELDAIAAAEGGR